MKRALIVLLLLGAAAGGGYYYYRQQQVEAQSDRLTLYGNVDIRDVALGFRVSGRIARMRFDEGDAVDRGEVIATLDQKPYQQEFALKQADLAAAQAALKNAERRYQRQAELIRRGTIPQSEFDEALAARDQAEAAVQTAKAALALAQTRLDDTELHAPERGTILTRVREPGAIVTTGETVYTLALGDPLWVRTYVDEPDLGYVHPGQKATVLTDTGGVYHGQVGFISPQAEFTPKTVETTQLRTDLVYRLRVIVPGPHEGLRQGMPVTVVIEKPGGTGKPGGGA